MVENEESVGGDHHDDLPRFAATREFVIRYGDEWSAWAFLVTGLAMLGLLALSFADAADAPAMDVLPAVLAFGGCAFVGGMFGGVLWSGLRDKPREREALKRG